MDATIDPINSISRLTLRSMALIAVFGATMFLVDFGPGWVLTYHEAYFAEPAREMLRSGDWIVPKMAGIPSWQKPPLTHWMIAATMGLFRSEAEWVVRLPAHLCTILSALFIAAIAARWYGNRLGLLAGLIQLTTFSSLFQGRLAEADMPLCAAISGGMLALALGATGKTRAGWPARLGFFIAAGASFLIKGPFGPVLLGGSGLLFALVERRKVVWRFLFDPVGLALLAFLCLVWPIAAYRADPSVLVDWRVHNLDRFTGTYEGSRNPFFYLYMVPAILLPWTPLALGGLIVGWRDRSRPAELWRLMACWLGMGMALISASAWKHKHYPIPILPPLSIVAAYALDRYLREARRVGGSPAGTMALVLAAGGVGTIAFGWLRSSSLIALLGSFVALSGLGLGLSFRLRRAGHLNASLATIFGTIWVVVVLNQSLIMPRFDLYRPHAEMARRFNGRLAVGETLNIIDVPHPQILFYLRLPLRRYETWSEFAEAMQSRENANANLAVVGSVNLIPGLTRLGRLEILDRAVARTPTVALRFQPVPDQVASWIEAERETVRR